MRAVGTDPCSDNPVFDVTDNEWPPNSRCRFDLNSVFKNVESESPSKVRVVNVDGVGVPITDPAIQHNNQGEFKKIY